MLKIYILYLTVVRSMRLSWSALAVICFLFQLPARADEVVYRINSGGSSASSSVGSFAADKYFAPSPGSVTSTTKAIAGTSDDAIYQNQRRSNTNNSTFSYNLPVSGGQYRIKLFFAEIYWTKAGQRVFDVTAEGTKVLNNYDILTKVGAFTARTESFTVNVSDGTLNLYFSSLASDGGVNRPQVAGVEIVRVTSSNPSFTKITWGTAASQPYSTHEVHGEVVNGKLYIFGGYDPTKSGYTPTKRAYRYDPNTNTWQSIADLPHTPKGTNFGGVTHVGTATDGTNIYFAGGYPSNSTGTGQVFGTKQVWRYNVASNNYTALPSLPYELATGQLKYLNGKLHYMGGANKSRSDVTIHYMLDLNNLGAGWKAMKPLLDATNHAGSAVYNGKIYYFGGSHGQNDETVVQKMVQIYNPATNTWTRGADMPIGRDHISSTVVVVGNRILVLGGEVRHSVKSNLVSAYSPATNSWQELTPMPAQRSGGVAGVLNGNIYYTGGNQTKTNYRGVPVLPSSASLAEEVATVEPQNETLARQIAVYPNPINADSKLSVEIQNFRKEENVTLTLFDLLGRNLQSTKVVTTPEGTATIEMPVNVSLKSGMYILEARSATSRTQTRIVKE